MKFYSISEKKPIEVKKYSIMTTSNNRTMAVGTDKKGNKVYKLVKKGTQPTK